MPKEEPKPCPFCGKEPKSVPVTYGYHSISCEDKECPITATVVNANRAQGITQWNRRA